jgi:predicted metalloprotease
MRSRRLVVSLILVVVSLGAGYQLGRFTAKQEVAPPLDAGPPHGIEAVIARVFSRSDGAARLGAPTDVESWTVGRLDQFWRRYLPDSYEPIPLEPYDSVKGDWPRDGCGLSHRQLTENAFFCSDGEQPHVVADHALYARYRRLSDATDVPAITVLAHEWGHYASHLLAHDDRDSGTARRSLPEELQADCFAGMFLGWLAEQRGVTAEAVERGAEVLFELGDDRDVPWSSEDRHGSPTQRLQAFRDGQTAERGSADVQACRQYLNYRGKAPDLGGGLEILLPPKSKVEVNKRKNKTEVVAPGNKLVEVAIRRVVPSESVQASLEKLKQQWFSGSTYRQLSENSDAEGDLPWALVTYEQQHPRLGPLHGTLFAMPVPDNRGTVILVDRYESGPAPPLETNEGLWADLVDDAFAYARAVRPIH